MTTLHIGLNHGQQTPASIWTLQTGTSSLGTDVELLINESTGWNRKELKQALDVFVQWLHSQQNTTIQI